MSDSVLSPFARPPLNIIAATLFGVIVGYLHEGNIGGGLVLGITIASGVMIGLLISEVWNRYL